MQAGRVWRDSKQALSESGNGLKIGVLYCTYSYFRSALRMENGKYTLMIYNTGSAASGGKSASSRSVSVSYAAQSFVPDPKPVPRYTPDTSPYKVPCGRTLLYREWYTVMSGNDVKYIQACLYYLGYNVEIDGRYAGGTAYSSTALCRIQPEERLIQTPPPLRSIFRRSELLSSPRAAQ